MRNYYMQPDWLEPDFVFEPCFSGRPGRGNCPSPSSLRNQASGRTIFRVTWRAQSRNTILHPIDIRGFSSYNSRFYANWSTLQRIFGAIWSDSGQLTSGEVGRRTWHLCSCFISDCLYMVSLYVVVWVILLLFSYTCTLLFELVFTPFLVIYKIVLVLSCISPTFTPCFYSYLLGTSNLSKRDEPLHTLFFACFYLDFLDFLKIVRAIHVRFGFLVY